ncbi:MAG TPA: hypothetical protein VK835_02695 [Bacteroidia bacterium]|jgi:hypothetical protein|nr:hypothetical protein [Bacteroidia bacterium]
MPFYFRNLDLLPVLNNQQNGRCTVVSHLAKHSIPSSAGTYYYIIKLTATNSKGVSEQKDYTGYLELVR